MKFNTQKLSLSIIFFGIVLLFSSCRDTGSIGEFHSIPQLYDSCPGKCGEQLACEGQLASVWGYLDKHNIFADPQSAHENERFLIAERLDDKGFGKGKVIEVIPPRGGNITGLFEKLNAAENSSRIFVAGTVKGFDAPTNLSCKRLISLEIQGAENINTE